MTIKIIKEWQWNYSWVFKLMLRESCRYQGGVSVVALKLITHCKSKWLMNELIRAVEVHAWLILMDSLPRSWFFWALLSSTLSADLSLSPSDYESVSVSHLPHSFTLHLLLLLHSAPDHTSPVTTLSLSLYELGCWDCLQILYILYTHECSCFAITDKLKHAPCSKESYTYSCIYVDLTKNGWLILNFCCRCLVSLFINSYS